MKFGVEQEHFIFKDGSPPSIENINAFYLSLIYAGCEIGSVFENGNIGSVVFRSNVGSVEIKNDFCTHILEFAFSPFSSIGLFRQLYETVWRVVSSVLEAHNLKIHFGALLNAVPNEVFIYGYNEDAINRAITTVNRISPNKPYAEKWYPSITCATQVHIENDEDEFYSILPLLYRYEYLIPLFFTNSNQFKSMTCHCLRPLINWNAFENDYKAVGIPDPIPSNKNEYNAMLNSTVNFIRDYSYIVYRSFGTIEFRTACSQDSIDQIVELISLRYAILIMCRRSLLFNDESAYKLFINSCQTGIVRKSIVKKDLTLLATTGETLSSEMKLGFNKFLERAKHYFDEI